MRKILQYLLLLTVVLLSACGNSISEKDMEGKWIYKKVSHLKENPPLVLEGAELQKKHPYLVISEEKKLTIFSEDKVLSEGTYRLEGDIIRYEEVLEGGMKRKIPFLIKKLETNKLTFETMDNNTIQIVAEKE